MRYLKKFSLFESIKFSDIDLKSIWDVETYIECLAYFENQVQEANGNKDLETWMIAYSYKTFLLGSNYSDLLGEMENSFGEYEKRLIDLSTLNPEGFDYGTEILKYPIMKEIINNIGSCLFTIKPSSFFDKQIKQCISKQFKNIILGILSNVFWPGYMKNVAELKFLDSLDDKFKDWCEIEQDITDALEYSLEGYSTMEKDRSELSKKFLLLIEEFGKHNIRTFENVIFPKIMDEVIVEYFASNDPESFKKADQIRNMNIPLFDKIKALLPNIDTAADLGDLGF
jgi:hypothetical protein